MSDEQTEPSRQPSDATGEPQVEPEPLDDAMSIGDKKQTTYDGKPVEIEFFGSYSVMTDVTE